MNNQVFKALADPTRREIVRLLGKGEMSAGSLAEHFDMTKPTVSHHFSVLKEADLIVSRREGQQIMYSLNTTVAEDVLAWLWDLLGGKTKLAGAGHERKALRRGERLE
jgi:ArsR family transcriptional regulator